LAQPVNFQAEYNTLAVSIIYPQHLSFSSDAGIEDVFLPEVDLNIAEGRNAGIQSD
jgi:hypothetical protein